MRRPNGSLPAVATAATVLLAACTGGGSTGAGHTTSASATGASTKPPSLTIHASVLPTQLPTATTGFCGDVARDAPQIAAEQAALYQQHGSDAALAALIADLQQLQHSAPDDVRSAIADLVSGFRSAQQLLQRPSQEAGAQLSTVSARLSTDSQRISAYVTRHCLPS